MAWLYEPKSRYEKYRDESPKRYPAARATWRSPRRSRLFSWCLCLLIVLVIVFWPHRSSDTVAKARQKRPSSPVQPRTRYNKPGESDLKDGPKNPKKQKKQRPVIESAEHTYRTDGLLDVNPRGKHPIFELIERSETQWKRKVERQSKTLKQAVEEYKRRYKRAPPKGFEIWWDYADFHDVKLVDEYDSIHARLQPFWGVAPSVLREAQSAWESQPETFTIGKLPGSSRVTLLNETMNGSRVGHQRVEDQIALLEDVEEWLPEFRATFTIHDGPTQFVSWELRRKAEEAAAKGEYIDVGRVAASTQAKGWAAACPPDTPIHTYVPPPLPTALSTPLVKPNSAPQSSSSPKSFIYNHRLAMSPCLHPTHIALNGYLSQFRYPHQYGPSPSAHLAPTFSICVSPLHNDILTVAPEQFAEEVGVDREWEEKVDERLLWRGSNTGVLHQEGNAWNMSQRIRLIEMGTRRGGEMRVLLPRGMGGHGRDVDEDGGRYGGEWDGPVGYGETVRTGPLNAAFMDVSFVGKPIQCREPVCGQLRRMFEWRAYQTWEDAWVYKYIMDIDGNGWSARFKRLMTSRSLIFKSTMFPEWYTERIMPWVHYIPVQVDLSDLYDILAFFRGDLSGNGAHDDLAQRIATEGKKWSETFYRREDMTAYHFRLFLEYARVMSSDRDAMSYKEGDEGVDEYEGGSEEL